MSEQATKTLTKYRQRDGRYIENDPNGVSRLYVAGQVFTSVNDNLHERWPERFELLQRNVESFKVEPPPGKQRKPPSIPDGERAPQNKQEYLALLAKMSLEELVAHAADEEIDLKGAKDKATVLKAIKSELS